MALRDVIVSMDYEAGGLKVELNIMQNDGSSIPFTINATPPAGT